MSLSLIFSPKSLFKAARSLENERISRDIFERRCFLLWIFASGSVGFGSYSSKLAGKAGRQAMVKDRRHGFSFHYTIYIPTYLPSSLLAWAHRLICRLYWNSRGNARESEREWYIIYTDIRLYHITNTYHSK